MEQKRISIVVPVYESENTLNKLYERTDRVFDGQTYDYEMILVEDCGNDNSWPVMQSLRQRDKRVKIVQLSRNAGQHAAILCGFSFITGDYVITMDDDLQNPPEEIPKMIDAIENSGFDVVNGIPEKKNHSALRNLCSFVFRCLVSIIYKNFKNLEMSSFRILRRDVVDQINHIQMSNPIIDVLILNTTGKIGSIQVKHDVRGHGSSTYSTLKLFRNFTNSIVYNTGLPLKLVFAVGLLSLFLSLVLGLFYFISYLLGRITVPGWTTIVLLLLFFSGMIMSSIGVVGEYLFKIMQEVRHRPPYVIKKKEI